MIGVVFATLEEAEPFLELTGAEKLSGQPPCWRFRDGVVVISGMGRAAAAEAAEYLIGTHRVSQIVNAGACGAAADGIEAGTVYRITQARDGDRPDAASVACEGGAWASLPGARLTTSDEPVFDPGRRRHIAQWGELVDMEGAAVARTCAVHGIPCILLKGVTDHADDAGRETLRANLRRVSVNIAGILADGLGCNQCNSRATLAKLLNFTKIEHTVFSLPLLFSGAWIGAGGRMPSLGALGLILLAGAGARVLGMSMNRILDRKLDALNPRTADRELPSGRMTVGAAWAVAVGGLLIYLIACALLGPLVLALSPVPAVVLIGYSLLKRYTPLCHYGIGLCLGMAPAGAWVAVSGTLRATPGIVLLSVFAFFWMSGFDIIYGLMDIESDRRTGARSLPAWIGSRRAQIIAAAGHAVSVAALVALAMRMGGGVAAWAAVVVSAGGFVCAYLPSIPLRARFFPVSAVAGVAGALVPVFASL